MHPPLFVVDHRIGPDPAPADARHRDRPIIRRSQPEALSFAASRHDAPHGPAEAHIPAVPSPEVRKAQLVALANDPRFKARVQPRPVGLRLRLGQALMRAGWRLLRANSGEKPQAG
ncbi:MAG TPA: hypothetical protein VLA27_04890 [Paracoccaceae bacterium]|nr:hypothetical protein [Paracoccaceae bacterium]